jgi:hypothetical protein
LKKTIRAGIAGLALVAAIAAPISEAGATPPPAATGNALVPALTTIWAAGFVLCTGMMFGRQDMLAAQAGTVVTAAERWKALGECLLPPTGFAQIAK